MADGFNFQPYIQPYVSPPVEDFNTLGQTLNQRYEQNIANMTELELLSSQIQVLPTSQRIKDQMLADVNRTLTEIRERGDVENAAPRVREAVRRFATDPNLKQAAENYQRAQQFDEEVRQMRLQGKNPYIFQDYRTEQFDESGRLLPIMADNQARLDYSARYKTFFDQIQPETFASEETGWRRRPDGIYEQYGVATQRGGIARQRIENIANERLEEYLATDEGIQEMRALTSSRYGNLSPEQARQQIRQNLIGAGMERVFQSQTSSTSSRPIDDPYLDRQIKLQQLENARNAGKQSTSGSGSSSGLWNALVNSSTINLEQGESREQIKNTVRDAFNPESTPETRASNEAVLLDRLQQLLTSKNPKVVKGAQDQLAFINKMKAQYPNNYNEILYALEDNSSKGRKSLSEVLSNPVPPSNSSAVLRSLFYNNKEVGKELIDEYFDLRERHRTDNRNFLFDSSFENAYQDAVGTRRIPIVKPDWNKVEAGQRTALKEAMKDYYPTDFNLLQTDNKEVTSMADVKGNVEITGVSNGSAIPGVGVAFEVRDKDGNKYLVRPKQQDIVNSFADAWGMPYLKYLDDAATGGTISKALIKQAKSGVPAQMQAEMNRELLQLAASLKQGLNLSSDEVKELVQPYTQPTGGSIPVNLDKLEELVDRYR